MLENFSNKNKLSFVSTY